MIKSQTNSIIRWFPRHNAGHCLRLPCSRSPSGSPSGIISYHYVSSSDIIVHQISCVFVIMYHQISLCIIRYHVSSCIIWYHPFTSLYCCLLTFPHRPHHHPNHQHHGPVSTIQKTGWVWSGLEKGFTYLWMRSLGRSQNPVYLAIFGMVTNEQRNKETSKQPTGPSASLLFTSEKAVFCNN